MRPGITADQILYMLARPEQDVFDWKTDFTPPRDDDAKGEFVKDVLAIANATAFSHDTGYVFFGVDPRRPKKLLGVTTSYDDASLQQLVASATDPPIEFLYYEVAIDVERVSVVEVPRSRRPFHVVKRDVGRLREGQIPIRDGSRAQEVDRTVEPEAHKR